MHLDPVTFWQFVFGIGGMCAGVVRGKEENVMRKWPDEVPILGEDSICRWTNERGNKRCLMGWFRETVAGEPQADVTRSQLRRFYGVVRKESESLGLIERDVTSVNDCNEPSLVARIFNRAMARLGYVVNNPECDRNGKLKPVK